MSVHNVDPRTAFRRSDRGADPISYLIRDSYFGVCPWRHISLIQNGPGARFRLEVSVDSGAKWSQPYLTVNGQEVDCDVFNLHDAVQDPMRSRAVHFRDPDLMVREQKRGFARYRIRIHWQMPVRPTWQISATIADPRVFARIFVSRDNSVSGDLDWSPREDTDRPAQFAFEPLVENPRFTPENPHHAG